MRLAILLTLAVNMLAQNAAAQSVPNFTPEMQAMEAKLLTRVGPETRTWIKQQAARETASTTISDPVRATASYPSLRGLNDADVMALAFLVMMESAKSAQEDLKAIMDGVKAINNAKAAYIQAGNRSTVRPREDIECLDRIASTESLRLQMAMDRALKFMVTLSNLLKKISDTAASITQNLK